MRRLRIILIAHDSKKTDLVEWARFNVGTLSRHELIGLVATGDDRRADVLGNARRATDAGSVHDANLSRAFPSWPLTGTKSRRTICQT